MKRNPDALTEGTFDLLILGGGITGAGVALDAATRGLRVALIDKGDFASGTSSASSKLVHGGLRYLEHGEFRLVYEALHERARLLRNAPHLVRPLRFLLPQYAGSRVSPWKWRAGLLLYDVLAGRGNIRRSRSRPLAQVCRELPGLRRAGLVGAMEFFDAQMDDARLCIEVLRTAAIHGVALANYVEAIGFEHSGGRVSGVRAVDHPSGRELRIHARQILNAAGPWADAVRRLAGENGRPLLRPTKGVHVIVPDRALSAAFLLLHPADGRVFFVIPWLGKTLIGTTDTECHEPPDQLSITDEDVRYVLEGHNHYFQPHLGPGDVLGRFAGLRPLVGGAGGPDDLSREYALTEGPTGLLTVTGGKYTTFRHMAEGITNAIVRGLGLRVRCRTRDLRLDGAPDGPWASFVATEANHLTSHYPLDRPAAMHLIDRYGRRAEDVAIATERDPALAKPVVAGEPELLAEFAYHREREMALAPADYLVRRTRLGLFRPELIRSPPAPTLTG